MMKHSHVETSIHAKRSDLTPRELLIGLLEDEGDVLGWEEDLLVYEASMRLEGSQESSTRMARMALGGLLRDGVVVRDGRLICLKE
jgi:hypothetical protein